MKEVVYTPDAARALGWRVWGRMLRELVASRGLIVRLFVRDVAGRYRQSWLGYVWAVLPPCVMVLSFWYLRSKRVIPAGATPIPYAAYALWGMGVWQLFSGCYNAAASALVGGGSMVTKINFPKEALVFAAVGQPFLDFAVRLVPVVVVFAVLGVVPASGAVFLPLVLLPLVMMAIGLGMIMAILNTFMIDLGQLLGMALNFGLLLTPVLYPPAQSWPFGLLNIFNPVSPIMIATHDLIARGTLSSSNTFAMSCLFALLLFGLGWRFFRLGMMRVAERF
jgi:lipopolysaccharide transport system permease protein